MATIVIKTSRLSVVDKCERGNTIIELSTGNPRVPGNEVPLAAFSEVQAELYAAELAVVGARSQLAALVAKRNEIEKRWDATLSQLAGFTEFATGGEPTSMVSAGFRVREQGGPAHIPEAPINLLAATTETPGRTRLTWEPISGTLIYLVQMTLSPLPDDGWKHLPITTRAACEVNGAEPGKVAWFRIAAVNTAGQGPWSAPACRPVV